MEYFLREKKNQIVNRKVAFEETQVLISIFVWSNEFTQLISMNTKINGLLVIIILKVHC